MQKQPFVLVVDPDADSTSKAGGILGAAGIQYATAVDGESGWSALAKQRPDVVLMSLRSPGLDDFYRHLRDEYMGLIPRMIGLATQDEIQPSVANLDLDGILLAPITSQLMLTALNQTPARDVTLDVGRMRELMRLTCLGGEFQESLDAIAGRLALVYGLNDCVVLANATERQWVGTVGQRVASDQWPELWERCNQAVDAGAPILLTRSELDPKSGSGAGALVETRFAAPINAPTGAIVGAICLFNTGGRLYSNEARDSLADLAQRIGAEIAWRSVHDRVAAERDRLRETAMLDPLLGIQSRAALEQALNTEVGRYHRNGDPLSIAMVDILGLRLINDRHGHLAGDAALKHVANVTQRLIRAQDVVGRYGGDEIAILLPATPTSGATTLLRRVCACIETEPFTTDDGTPIKLSVTVGVTEFRDSDTDVGALLVRAAASGYAAKRRGETIGVADASMSSALPKPDDRSDVFEAGITLGGMYEIVHEISRGAMGVVYRAEDLGLSRPVAIKMLRPDLISDKPLVVKFRQEAGILASLNHENLVRVYAFVEDKDDVFFVMELVEGVSLDGVISEFLEADTFAPVSRVKTVVTQIASALDAMHHAHVMHRDVKPGNIVLDRARDRAVLVDVGLAQHMGQRGEPAGTPGFIAPESFRGGPETPATDVYGLAATAYTLLCGRAPFGRSDDYREILRRQLDERPPLASTYRRDLPTDTDLALLRGLKIDWEERYSTAGEFARELCESLAGVSDEAPVDVDHGDEDAAEEESSPSVASFPQLTGSEGGADQTLPLNLDLLPPAVAQEPAVMTRGIIFRSAARVLGLRASTAWVRTIARSNTGLADALSIGTSPMAWLPARYFYQMSEAVASSGRNAETFGRQLGTIVVSQTFRRFYPSSAESLSPGQTLSALEILWHRYHTWGRLDLVELEDGEALVRYEGPTSAATCSFATGWLDRVVSMSGGKKSRVSHNLCRSRGDEQCEFSLNWSVKPREITTPAD